MTTNIPPTQMAQNAQDEALVTAVREALKQYTPIRIWGEGVQIDGHAGTVVIAGVARSVSSKETAERIAKGVKGVSVVQNCLVVDAEVELAVAQALAADTRTPGGFPGILVGVTFGVNYLKGSVPTAEMKAAAEEVARQVPGVKSVSNELLTVPPAPAAPERPAALRPAA